MVATTPLPGVQFGRATLVAVVGGIFAQPVEAVVLGTNRRGVFGLGVSAALRDLGGPLIEREATTCAPLEIGSVLVTGAYQLEQRGVRAVLHAVIAPTLGQPARPADVRRALAAVMLTLEQRRYRSVAIPLLGTEAVDRGEMSEATMIDVLIGLIVGSLRRGAPRLTTVVIVTEFADQAQHVIESALRLREHSWRQESPR